MAESVYTTLLNFVSDSSQANRDIKQTTENLKKMEEQIQRATFSPAKLAPLEGRINTEEMSKAIREMEENLKREGILISKSLKDALFFTGELSEANYQEIAYLQEKVGKIMEAKAAQEEEKRAAIEAARERAASYSLESSILQKQVADIHRRAQVLRNQAQQVQGISQLGIGIGTGVVGGIFAYAAKYVRDAKEATQTTKEWNAAQQSLAKSGERIGTVMAQEALPLLKIAAETARKAADFVEKHPEIIKAALNTGLVVAGLGAVGLLVSKGIKLYADQLYLTSVPLQIKAGELQLAAAHEQLLAARIKAGTTDMLFAPKELGKGAAGVGGVGAISAAATSIGLIIAGVIAAKYAIDLTNVVLQKTGIAKSIADAQKRIAETSRRPYPGYIAQQGEENVARGGASASYTGSNLAIASTSSRERAVAAFEDYKNEDTQMLQDYYAERTRIIGDGLKAEARVNQQYASDAAKIRANLGSSIAQATRSYQEQNRQAEIQYAQERARIVRDGGLEIQRIEADLQETLRKQQLEHSDRVEELIAARDAVGLLKEQKRYEQERNEQIRGTNIEIQQRRQDLAIRLEDLRKNFEQERAQRFEEFKARIEEMRAQADAQLKELRERHVAEIAQLRSQRAERLQELDSQFNLERRRRYDQFVAQLRDIDAALTGERNLRQKRQNEMLVQLDQFLLAYKAKLATLQTTATPRAGGGYASYGNYLLGDAIGGGPGKREYVLSGDTTELAERVLGGQLTQQRLASLLRSSGSNRRSIVYNDGRRYDSSISNADREKMRQDALDLVAEVLR